MKSSTSISRVFVIVAALFGWLISTAVLHATDVHRIAVVFHKVHYIPTGLAGIDFSAQDVANEIAYMNLAYRNLAPNRCGQGKPPEATDTYIEFFAAGLDKDGNPASYCVDDYTNLSHFTSQSASDYAIIATFPSLTQFPTTQYLNILVYPMVGANGEAYSPPNYPGPTLPAGYPDICRVALFPSGSEAAYVHEVGHWLGLAHVTDYAGRFNYMYNQDLSCTEYFTDAQASTVYYCLTYSRYPALYLTEPFVTRKVSDNSDLGGDFTVNGVQTTPGVPASVPPSASFSAKTNTEMLSGLKHWKWNTTPAVYRMQRNGINYGQGRPVEETALYTTLSPVTSNVTVEGIPTNGEIDVLDPWYVNNGIQPDSQWVPYTSGFTASTMPHGGIFLNQGDPGNWTSSPFYTLSTPINQTVNLNSQQISSYFYFWSGTNVSIRSTTTPRTGVIFNTSGSSAVANLKGQLRTNMPTRSDAQNQRRAVSTLPVSPHQNWNVVYESMGDVWWSSFTDNQQLSTRDVRLNIHQGQASNPTISNVLVSNGTARVVIAWLEQNGSTTELHLQSMFECVDNWWGWNISNSLRSANNHRLISEFYGVYVPRSTARPVLQLDQNGSGYLLTVAYETTTSGIFTVILPITSDLGDSPTWPQNTYTVSANGSDTNPVIISYPTAYGFAARKCLYFIAGGYASGRRIAQWDYSTHATVVLPTGSGDYTYTSLQGAPNPSSASFALVASGLNNSSQPFVNYYVKSTYLGSSPASLSVAYPGMQQPTIMVENSSVFGAPTTEIDMASPSGTWSKGGSISLTTLGTSISGVFSKASVSSGDRTSIVVRYHPVNINPARLDWYSGSGQLSKVGDVPVDIQAVRYWSQNGSPERPLMLDFSGTDIVPVDSLETGQIVCAVQVLNPGAGGAIVRQVDSLALPLQVDLMKSGRTVRSFASSSWTSLTTGSIPQLASGDILRFSLVAPAKLTRGYLRISQRGVYVQKEGTSDQSTSVLQLLPNTVAAYPNPFNPSTTLAFQLAEPAMVKLIVYDILGREVAQLVNGLSEAGSHSVVWNASRVSSGVYYARFTATDGLGNSKAHQVTRLLLTK